MTFKELLYRVSFDDVAPEIVRMYPEAEHDLMWYRIHFDMLRLMEPKHHDDANSNVCNIMRYDWEDGRGPFLDVYPMEGDWWEHSLTKEIKICTDEIVTNEEIVACCLWHTSFWGYVRVQQEEEFRFDEGDMEIEDRWDDYIYYKVRAEKYYSIIRKNGGFIPSVKELAPEKKQELISKARENFSYVKQTMKKKKRGRLFHREFMARYYERMMNISRFIVQVIPALCDGRNKMGIEQLCRLFHSDLFSSEVFTSYADEKTNGILYFIDLFENYSIKPKLDRVVIVLTTGEYHQELTEDEEYLCRLLVGGCKSSDILLATDPSLGRQVRINYATFNLNNPLIKK